MSLTAADGVGQRVAGPSWRPCAVRRVHLVCKLPPDLPPVDPDGPPDEEPEPDEPLEPAPPPEEPVPV